MRTNQPVYSLIIFLLIAVIAFQAIPALSETSPDTSGSFLYEEAEGGIIITGYDGDETRLILPSTLDGKAVVGVRDLGVQSGVEHITIPDDVHILGNPFGGCYALTGFDVSSSHPELCLIDNVLFTKGGERLIRYPSERPGEIYAIPEGVQVIGDSAFADCPFLKQILIPDSMETIEAGAFSLCSLLEEITIPSGVSIIGEMAFANAAIRNVDLSACTKISDIPARLFYGCWQLKQVALPPAVNSIGDEAFAFSGLESFMLPATVRHIGINPFRNCHSLHEFRTEESIQEFIYNSPYLIDLAGNRLISRFPTAEERTDLPEVAEIGDYSFAADQTLIHLVVPSSVIRIGAGAFTGCSNLEDVVIRECAGLRICRQAFSECRSLTHVTIMGDVSILEEDIFIFDDSLQEITSDSVVVQDYCRTNSLSEIKEK